MIRALISGVVLLSSAAEAQESQSSDQLPRMSNFRYDEDYSYLRDPSPRSGQWWEGLKYIPLNPPGDVFLSLGNELRVRYELLRNDNFGDGPQDDDGYLWGRLLPYADLHAGKHFRVFTQLISAFAVDPEPAVRAVDEDQLDLLQGFADLRLPLFDAEQHVTLRGGRQMLGYGSERLISNRYGPNVLETFDGIKAFSELGNWRADIFWMRPVEADRRIFDDQTDDSRSLWSVYVTRYFNSKENGFDAYYIGYDEENATFNQGSADEQRQTIGSRIFGAAAGWDWNTELFYQFGNFGQGRINAWSAASDTGYTFSKLPLTPRFSLKANIVSGDTDPADPDLQTFNALFPKGKYFGEIGLLGPYNLINVHPSLELNLTDRWSTTVAGVLYWRQSERDGIYDNSGNLIRSDGGSRARFIGTQAEVLLNFHPSRHLEFEIALSQFMPGRFIEETGRSDTAYFASAEIRFAF